jgi:hypothetical protein
MSSVRVPHKWRATMGKQRDRRPSPSEPLSAHATFQLGIDYSFRNAFGEGRPMPRETYESYLDHSSQWAYFVAPPYEEYLRMYDMYSRTCRLRDAGLSECEAAEAVRNRRMPDLYPLDAASFDRLGLHHRLRGAFSQGRALSRDEYEYFYVCAPMLPEGVAPYDEYASNWYYGEMGAGPMSREEYIAQHCFVAPPYEEYLQLYKRYSESAGKDA